MHAVHERMGAYAHACAPANLRVRAHRCMQPGLLRPHTAPLLPLLLLRCCRLPAAGFSGQPPSHRSLCLLRSSLNQRHIIHGSVVRPGRRARRLACRHCWDQRLRGRRRRLWRQQVASEAHQPAGGGGRDGRRRTNEALHVRAGRGRAVGRHAGARVCVLQLAVGVRYTYLRHLSFGAAYGGGQGLCGGGLLPALVCPMHRPRAPCGAGVPCTFHDCVPRFPRAERRAPCRTWACHPRCLCRPAWRAQTPCWP